MTLRRGDRVFETSVTTGTGTYTLAGAATGYQAFSAICSNTDTVEYCATDANHGGSGWEVGLGTWATGGTLARTTIYASSNANAAVNWSNTVDIFNDIPANFVTTSALFDGTLSVTGHTTFEGVTSTGATGTAKLVYSASPTFTGTLNAAAITATGNVSGAVFTVTGGTPSGTGTYLATTNTIGFMANGAGIGSFAAASLKLGGSDSASPTAQLLRVQNVVTGTTDTAGANLTIAGSQGTGTGAGGSHIWQVAPASTTGSTPNTLVTGASLTSAGIFDLNQSGSILRLQGANFATYPNTDSTATGASTAVGVSALSTQNAAGSAAYNNTAVGYQAVGGGTLTTTAIKNTAVGFSALNGLTSGASNTVIGWNAGVTTNILQTGSTNVLIGARAKTAATNTTSSVGIGENVSVAGSGVAIGQAANATGAGVIVGVNGFTAAGVSIGNAAQSNTSTSIAIGTSAGSSTLPANSIAIGDLTLANASGTGTTALGSTAGEFISSGANNTAVGFRSMLGITGTKLTGAGNTAIGKDAGLALQGVAATNTLIGISAGDAITSGVANVVIGANVAHTQATGGSNIYIGCSSAIDASSSSTSNELKIGNSSTPVISATGINSTPVITLGGATTITTSANTPILFGGTANGQSLTIKPTTGTGSAGADLIFGAGSNGATQGFRIFNDGSLATGTGGAASASQGELNIRSTASTNGTLRYDFLVYDNTAQAVGTGGGMAFSGHDGVQERAAGGFYAYKENNTSGNYSYSIKIATRTNGATPADAMVLDSNLNLAIGTGTGSWGGGTGGCVFIANRTAAPSSNPTGGGILYCEAGALKYRGSSGTVTVIANA